MTPDYLGDEVATHRLAKKIATYWAKRGKDAGIYVTRQRPDTKHSNHDGMFVIRSAMVAGMPQENPEVA